MKKIHAEECFLCKCKARKNVVNLIVSVAHLNLNKSDQVPITNSHVSANHNLKPPWYTFIKKEH